MQTVSVTEGTYAGEQAKVFGSSDEFFSAIAEGQIGYGEDGSVVGFPHSEMPWAENGKDYAIPVGSNVNFISWHDLPPPGNPIHTVGIYQPNSMFTITSPGASAQYRSVGFIDPASWAAIIGAIIFILKLLVVAIVVLVIAISISMVLARWRALTEATVMQVSDSIGIVSTPTGAVDTVDKNTGEILHHEDAPFDLKLALLIGLGIFAVIVIAQMMTSKSGDSSTLKGLSELVGSGARSGERVVQYATR